MFILITIINVIGLSYIMYLNVFPNSFSQNISCNPNTSFPLIVTGGRDDSKLIIPATVVLRFMFTPAEMRVSPELSLICRTFFP